jgi:hypothetical protein
MAAVGEQIIHKSQSVRGRHSPREHILAAYPVLEMSFPFQDQDLVANASQFCGEGGPSEAAADRDQIEAHWSFPPDPSLAVTITKRGRATQDYGPGIIAPE